MATTPDSTAISGPSGPRGVSVRIRGTVQGVGFRPYVYRLARSLSLSGHVRNDDEGVWLVVEGEPRRVAEFLARLPQEAPALARLQAVEVTDIVAEGRAGFVILDSQPGPNAGTVVTPDAATCDACLAELFDPADRRYRYPFINCTACGPRFTIVTGTPYDRPRTTMADFRMCAPCRAEFEDPASRRFHAQPNACPTCGPRLALTAVSGDPVRAGTGITPAGRRHAGSDVVSDAAALLLAGRILAVKGIGGYHLACRADHEATVARLRRSKHREEKPFALMVADLDAAGQLAELGDEEATLMSGPERPIVLVPRRRDGAVAPSVAPGARELGLMLPYSPLHHLLLAETRVPLVMTSGNVSDEPIAHDDADAAARLAGIADAILSHDRRIHVRADDSVARVTNGSVVLLRRSRGYVPAPLPLPCPAPPLLACGAQLKNTFCVAEGGTAILGPHIGDVASLQSYASFRSGIDHFLDLFRIAPALVVHDLHPEYLATKHALERAAEGGLPTMGIQHHHAHFAACLAEHGESGPAIGAIYDGTGYGTDGTIWGGELLVGGLATFHRAGRLRAVPMPGGEAAIREPWRMAAAWLCVLDPGTDPPLPPAFADRVDERRWSAVLALARTGVSAPVTTSMGRLFDAVSAFCGIRTHVTYEGQAAIELERAADPADPAAYEIRLQGDDEGPVMDPEPMLRALLADLADGCPVPTVAARFHNAIAATTVDACTALAREHGTRLVALSGGVFQNALLLQRVTAGLLRAGLRPLIPARVPPNDGGIAYGQAAVAAARTAAGGTGPIAGGAEHR